MQGIEKHSGDKLAKLRKSPVKRLADRFLDKPIWKPRGKFTKISRHLLDVIENECIFCI